MKKVAWKNLLRCNQRETPCSSGNTPKKVSKTTVTTTDLFSMVFSANSCRSQFEPQSKTVKPSVSHCEAVCGTPATWVTSVYLREAETRCRGVCALLSRGTVLSLETSEATQEKRREPGESPILLVTLSAHDSARFCLAGPRQNAQGKGSTEGLKKEQDKAVTSPPDTPARSADRILRFLDIPEHFKSVLRNVP